MSMVEFAHESNGIEGITDFRLAGEEARRIMVLISRNTVTIDNLNEFNVHGDLRKYPSMDVSIGRRLPIGGGVVVESILSDILKDVNDSCDPFIMHQRFELLHPYMDGNGRTGRALWAFQMTHQYDYNFDTGFLQMYYYQSLDHAAKPKAVLKGKMRSGD